MTDDYSGERSLADIRMLAKAPVEIREFFTGRCAWRTYQKDNIILVRDESSTSVYFIIKGKVEIRDFGFEQEIVLGERDAGGTFGEMSAIDSKKRSARIVALEETDVAILPSKDFRQLLLQVPETALTMLERYTGTIRRLTERIKMVSATTPHQRIYMELLRISLPSPVDNDIWRIEELPRHQEIASMTSTEVPDVAAAIGILARAGLVTRRNKSLILKDHARITELATL